MVLRDELKEDLIHLLLVTQWPKDNTSTLGRAGANRVPKPPRVAITPTFHREVQRDTPHRNIPPPSRDQESVDSDEGESISCFRKTSNNSGFDLESFISSLDPNNSIDLKSQYTQIDPFADVDVTQAKRPYHSSSKSVAADRHKHHDRSAFSYKMVFFSASSNCDLYI